MSADAKLEKWIKSSVSIYFDTGKGSNHLYIEGDEINMTEREAWVELRITGPRYLPRAGGHYDIELDVNIACTVKMGNNQYAIETLVGIFRKLADASIPVNKYGDTNPAEFIGCLNLRYSEPNPLDVIPWGRMTVDSASGPIRVMNTTIDAYYVMEI